MAAVLVVGAVALIACDRAPATSTTTPSTTGPLVTPEPTGPPEPLPSSEMAPAWLAWIAGSLPPGFAEAATRTPGLGTTVVVAGDTRWLTGSRDAEGQMVDSPRTPFAIPIDAFAVTPRDYAPFLPERYRREVTEALRAGDAVIGQTSAVVRRLGVGGSLSFGGTDIAVGAVVPDDVVGWAEMMVSRPTGRRIGIVRDRYLLSLAPPTMTTPRFDELVGRLLPGTDVKTVAPGGSMYMRIADGVNPPVVTKVVFGEFAAVRQADPAFLTIDPAWVQANITTRSVPLLGRVTCHRLLLGPLIDAMHQIEREGLGDTIKVYSGCWAARTVARSSTAPPSQHAYGAAIDINAPFSPYGSPPNFDPRGVAILEGHGFNWGGDFLIPDGHHFEWGLRTSPPA